MIVKSATFDVVPSNISATELARSLTVGTTALLEPKDIEEGDKIATTKFGPGYQSSVRCLLTSSWRVFEFQSPFN